MKRDCYCNLWKTKPEVLRERGIPEGFCGNCERCGRPGHVSHYPGPVPYTGAWCDRCYRILAWTCLLRVPRFWILWGVLGCVLYAVVRALL